MEVKVLVDVSDRVYEVLDKLTGAILISNGDYQKAAEGHQTKKYVKVKDVSVNTKEQPSEATAKATEVSEPIVPSEPVQPDIEPAVETPEVKTEPVNQMIDKDSLRALCAKAAGKGVNVSEIMQTVAGVKRFVELKQDDYETFAGAVMEALGDAK